MIVEWLRYKKIWTDFRSFDIIQRFAEHPCGNEYMPTFVFGVLPRIRRLALWLKAASKVVVRASIVNIFETKILIRRSEGNRDF